MPDRALALHLVKLCVGCDTVEDLIEWHIADRAGRPWTMHTRQTPKRAAELLDGGSLYRVFRGVILCRQEILGVETLGQGSAARCEVTLNPDIVRVAPTPRRAFQGWRYLAEADAPTDMFNSIDGEMPPDLARKLREAGAW